MCIQCITDNAWSIVKCIYYVVSGILFDTFMIDSGNKQITASSCVVLVNFKSVYVKDVVKVFR